MKKKIYLGVYDILKEEGEGPVFEQFLLINKVQFHRWISSYDNEDDDRESSWSYVVT